MLKHERLVKYEGEPPRDDCEPGVGESEEQKQKGHPSLWINQCKLFFFPLVNVLFVSFV